MADLNLNDEVDAVKAVGNSAVTFADRVVAFISRFRSDDSENPFGEAAKKEIDVANGVAGLDSNTKLSPDLLPSIPVDNLPVASTTQKGIAEQATRDEVSSGTDDTRFIVSTDLRNEIGEIASTTELTSGTETNVRRFSPKLIVDAIKERIFNPTVILRTTAYTIKANDNNKVIFYSGSSDVIFTLPNITAAMLANGYRVWVINSSSHSLTLNPDSADQIDNHTSLVLRAESSDLIQAVSTTEWKSLNRYEPSIHFRALTFSSSLNWDVRNSPNATITITANVTSLNLSNDINGGVYTLLIKQDATGNRNFTFPSAWRWRSGEVDTIAKGANDETIVTIMKINNHIYAAPTLKDIS